MRRLSKKGGEAADVDVTSFINLIVVLIPVLLMGMVLSHVTVLDIKLPDILKTVSGQPEEPPASIELIVRPDYIAINYPAGVQLKRIEKINNQYDYESLRQYLLEIKRQLADKGIKKRDITLLSEQTTEYQTLVSVMDTVRSYKAVQGTAVVNAELFPEVSLGDAPPAAQKTPAVPEGAAP